MARGDGALLAAMDESDLIYVTPIKSNGAESSCQAEVWFSHIGTTMYVVTAVDAWRTRAIRKGLTRSRIWVGDLGVWGNTDGRYKNLPMVDAVANIETDPIAQARALDAMGDRYPLEWVVWGPRFRNGLSDGSRVMLRYQPA
jgi:hypothetical protein